MHTTTPPLIQASIIFCLDWCSSLFTGPFVSGQPDPALASSTSQTMPNTAFRVIFLKCISDRGHTPLLNSRQWSLPPSFAIKVILLHLECDLCHPSPAPPSLDLSTLGHRLAGFPPSTPLPHNRMPSFITPFSVQNALLAPLPLPDACSSLKTRFRCHFRRKSSMSSQARRSRALGVTSTAIFCTCPSLCQQCFSSPLHPSGLH